MIPSFVTAVASVTFAGCAKYETSYAAYDTADENVEITFQLAPLSKASDANFSTACVFQTNAFYHPEDSRWSTHASDSREHIYRQEVSWTGGAWRMKDRHFWPSDGGNLTFFSWSLNRDDLSFHRNSAAAVDIDSERGVHLTGFDISLEDNLDFMVATASCDKTLGDFSSAAAASVATHFGHQLSKLQVSARTGDDYSGSKEFSINSIWMKNVARTGEYQQSSCESGEWHEIHRWTTDSSYDAVYGDYSAAPASVTAAEVALPGEKVLYIPQTFTDGVEFIEVNYTIRDLFSDVVENVTESIPLRSLIGGGAFRNGVLYTICLTLSLDAITWAPAVADWDGVS